MKAMKQEKLFDICGIISLRANELLQDSEK